MKRLKLKTLSLLLALALALSGCGRLEPVAESQRLDENGAPEQTVAQTVGEALATTYAADDVFALNAMFSSSFHPYLLSSAWNQVVSMLVYEPMVVVDESFEAQPGLISAWATADGRNWTFTVDTARRFHSGGKVTAVDCVYSLQMASYTPRYEKRFENVLDMETVDNGSFTVTLSSADYGFYKLLGLPCIESGSYYDDVPPGTGPYKFSAAGDMLLLDSNHPQADAMPLLRIYLKEYTDFDDILQAFEDSYIDLAINDPTSMSNLGYSSSNITRYVDTTNMHYLGYNMYSVIFSQPTFRAMMSYAVDRSGIASSCMGGAAVAAALPVHPNSGLYSQDIANTIAYSPDALQRVIDQMHLQDFDGDGFFELYSGISSLEQSLDFIVCADSLAKVRAASMIAASLEEVGLRVNLRELSYDDYIKALEEGDFDLYYAEVKLRPNWDLTELFTSVSSGGLNYGMSGDQFLTEYIRSYLASPAEMQGQAAHTLWQYIAQQAPITVVCFERSEVLYHRGVISGLEPTQDNVFNGMEGWTVDLEVNN